MTLYYLQTNILCIAVLTIVGVILGSGKNAKSTRSMAFSRLVLISIFICMSDVGAWYFSGKTFAGARALIQINNIIYYGSITLSAYAWLYYVELRLHGLEFDQKKFRRFYSIPMLVMIALLLINIGTGFIFSIDETNTYHREGGIFVHWIISWGYLLFATVEVARKMRKATSRLERSQLAPMIVFIIPPALAAVLQMLFYGITSTQCGVTVSILIIAVRFLMDEVSKDTLTGLNNRRALESYMEDRLQHGATGMTVLMCDVDHFKSINDSLGHAGGDRVLRHMGELLKSVCSEFDRRMFLCRFGGDEFVICGPDFQPGDLETLITTISGKFHELNENSDIDIKFGISVGYASGLCNTYGDVENLIAEADKKMYGVKAARNAGKAQ